MGERQERKGKVGFVALRQTQSDVAASVSDVCQRHVMYALRASEVRLRRVVEETLRVSIKIIMNKTVGFAPQPVRKDKLHAPHVAHFTVACDNFTRRKAYFTIENLRLCRKTDAQVFMING